MRKYFIVFCIIAAFLGIIYSAYLPFTKSRMYINSLRAMSSIHSLEDAEKNWNTVFDFYSPVGDEEVVKFLTYDILGLVTQENQPEPVVRELVRYIEPHALKNDVRHLLNVGHMYEILWRRFGHKTEDFRKAESYFLEAYKIGPKLPPVLYGLVGFYQEAGEFQKAGVVAEEIFKHWPQDVRVQAFLQAIQQSSSVEK